MHAGRWGVVSRPAAPPRGVVVVLVHVAPRAVISGTVEQPDDDQAGWPEQPLGCAGRLDRGRVRRRLSARSHTWIARVAADPPRAVLGGRELLRRRWLLSGVCVCIAATFSVRSRAPRSTRSPACAGWRSRECVDSTNLALERQLNARHGPRETSNRAWAGVGAVLVHGLLARPPINSRSFCRSWLRSRPVPAGLCLGAAGQRPETATFLSAIFLSSRVGNGERRRLALNEFDDSRCRTYGS